MHRTLISTLAAAALLAAGTLASPGAPSVADVAPAPATRATSLTFVAHDVAGNLAMADIADPQDGQPDIGDVIAFTQRLTRHGQPAGRVSNAAIGVDHRKHLFQSNGTMRLHDGTITFAGRVSQTPRFVLAVTGGTGHYRDATGTLTFHRDGNRQLLTLRLGG